MLAKQWLGLSAALSITALFMAGCAHGGERQIVRFQPGEVIDPAKLDMTKQSIILEFQEGEVLPLDVTVAGDVASSPPGASIPLTVKRHCFLRIDDRGLRISYDGRDFDSKSRVPGSFQFGVGVTQTGKRATLKVTTPVR